MPLDLTPCHYVAYDKEACKVVISFHDGEGPMVIRLDPESVKPLIKALLGATDAAKRAAGRPASSTRVHVSF